MTLFTGIPPEYEFTIIRSIYVSPIKLIRAKSAGDTIERESTPGAAVCMVLTPNHVFCHTRFHVRFFFFSSAFFCFLSALAAAFSALLLFESVLLSGASTFDVLAVRAISFASLFSGMCSPSRCKLFLPVGSGNDLFSII